TQDDWVQDARHRFQAGRDRLAAGLRDAGFAVLPSAATYFLSVDLTASGLAMNDVTFSERLVDEAKVATIPVSAFYAEDPVTNVVRFCFVKEDAVLDEALARVKAWRAALS